MLRQERTEDNDEALRLALTGWQSEIWTALPGIIDTVDLEKNTCTVQPTIKGIFRQKDGSTKIVTMPICLDVPIVWPRGGGFALTFPIKKGDEGMLVFMSRCFDAYWQNGGVQPQAEQRMHDLSDGYFILGGSSQPKKLANVADDAVELRNDDDGKTKVRLEDKKITAQVTDDVSAVITDTSIDLKVKADATIHMEDGKIALDATEIKLNGIVWDTHEHTGVQTGGAKTGGPTAP